MLHRLGKGDFTFDWCVSWLLGSGPGDEMHQIWLELGALQGKQMRNFDVFNVVRAPDGRAVYFYPIRTVSKGTCSASRPPTPSRSGSSARACGSSRRAWRPIPSSNRRG
ncbi:hypothetical protein SHKM778_57040 [Streptomyces sp. KM77-8]|uniref:Uncharacterized protein n=1 Tax=Streptomyces haneummycinicus TaxID=3074435 RepID=A0AAT9HQG5_9ACTN